MRPSLSMPLSGEPRVATNPPAFKKTPKPSRLRVANVDASAEPPQREKATYQAKAELPRGAISNRSESQNVDTPGVGQTPAEQQVHIFPPPKDPPPSGWQFAALAPGVTTTRSSRPTQDTTPGESQVPRERSLPEVPVCSNESRETGFPDKKGGHDSQSRPNSVSPLRVRRPTATEPPSLCQSSAQPPPTTSRVYYIHHRPQIIPYHLPFLSPNTIPKLLRKLLSHDLSHPASSD